MTGKYLEASAQLLVGSPTNPVGSFAFYDTSGGGMHHHSLRKTLGVAEGRYARERADRRLSSESWSGNWFWADPSGGQNAAPGTVVRLPGAACLQSAAMRISWQIIRLSFF